MWNINNIYDVVSVNKPKFPILDSPFFWYNRRVRDSRS